MESMQLKKNAEAAMKLEERGKVYLIMHNQKKNRGKIPLSTLMTCQNDWQKLMKNLVTARNFRVMQKKI